MCWIEFLIITDVQPLAVLEKWKMWYIMYLLCILIKDCFIRWISNIRKIYNFSLRNTSYLYMLYRSPLALLITILKQQDVFYSRCSDSPIYSSVFLVCRISFYSSRFAHLFYWRQVQIFPYSWSLQFCFSYYLSLPLVHRFHDWR